MDYGFWGKLKKPFFILAPMADVTDLPFRQIVNKIGRPDVFFIEFISADGISSPKGHDKLIKYLAYQENERPIVAQFFGSKPENFYTCAKLTRELGFDGIDINMGCPERRVVKQGAGIGLCKNPDLARQIVEATREGARSTSSGQADMPVSVKTRLGLDKIDMDWLRGLLKLKLSALSIHLRTMKEMSGVPAHWDVFEEIVRMRDELSPETLLIGNGDVMSLAQGRELAEEYKIDGVMIGRGVFHNPWVFNEQVDPATITPRQRLELLLEHTRLFTEHWGPSTGLTSSPQAGSGLATRNFDTLKRFYKIYVSHWDDAKELRTKLMETKNAEQVYELVGEYLKK